MPRSVTRSKVVSTLEEMGSKRQKSRLDKDTFLSPDGYLIAIGYRNDLVAVADLQVALQRHRIDIAPFLVEED